MILIRLSCSRTLYCFVNSSENPQNVGPKTLQKQNNSPKLTWSDRSLITTTNNDGRVQSNPSLTELDKKVFPLHMRYSVWKY